MQERTSLEEQLSGIGKVERELEDQIGMIEPASGGAIIGRPPPPPPPPLPPPYGSESATPIAA